jgi:uroporphyrinogen-III synthase
MGLDPVVAPIFTVRAVDWAPPAKAYDAILFTSGNAARCAGRVPEGPCYAVGEATAAAARAAGFADVRTGPADGAAVTAMMAADGVRRALHLCGRDHRPVEHPAMTVERRIVYAADAAAELPVAARDALGRSALVLLHSPRAAETFARMVPERSGVRIAAISPAAADAAGEGWTALHVAAVPRDEALLELAAGLCHIGREDAAAAGL